MFRRKNKGRDIVHRWEGNPIIRLDDLDFQCADLRSAGVTTYNNELILLVTIEHLEGYQSIHLARTDNSAFHVEKEPFIEPCRDATGCSVHESHGVMDARVTLLDGVYYIVYLVSGEHGYRLGLASTENFKTLKMHGHISEPDMKAGALFSEKIDGRYARLERPAESGSIWINYSDDLIYWGGHEVVLSPRDGFWDAARVGAGAPPMKIPEGWLLIYYGVKNTSAGPLFRLGAAILDQKDPTRLVDRSNIPILAPRENYERIGDLTNIVFTTGAFIEDGEVKIIYSGADSCVCLGTTTVAEIVDTCSKSRGDF